MLRIYGIFSHYFVSYFRCIGVIVPLTYTRHLLSILSALLNFSIWIFWVQSVIHQPECDINIMDRPFLLLEVSSKITAHESKSWQLCTWVLPLVGSQGNGDIILWDFENKTRRGPMLKMPSAVNALVINLAPWRMKGWNRKAQQILENQLKAGNEGKPFKEKSCKQKSNLWKNLEWKVVEML